MSFDPGYPEIWCMSFDPGIQNKLSFDPGSQKYINNLSE